MKKILGIALTIASLGIDFGNFADVYRPNFSRGYQDGYRVGQDERSAKRAG